MYDNRTERKSMAKYGNVTVALAGQDGNAFAIMAKVSGALRKGGAPENEIEEYLSESTGGDYDNLVQTAMKWVNIT